MSDPLERVQALIARAPYARFLGLRLEAADGTLTAALPFEDRLLGNVKWQALHGGALGALMEIAALAQLALAEGLPRLPTPIDVTIEYLKVGRPLTTFARAELRKVGRRVANVQVEAWQDRREQPVAALRGHFLLDRGG